MEHMSEDDFIKKFISQLQIEDNRYSCLIMALSDARMITGRNTKTGIKEHDIILLNDKFFDSNSFSGLIQYLIILDMIGTIFKTGFTTKKTNKIYKALKQYSNLNDSDIDIIISLRNSLAHNYGLINIPDSTNDYPTKLHKFTIINDPSAQLIEYPTEIWNTVDYSNKKEESSTKIGYNKLCDLVESVYINLKASFNNGLTELNLNGGIEELKSRFTVRH